MPAFHPRIRALGIGAAAIALLAVGVGGTFAASNPATLYACYDVYGNVRMSDTAQCKLPGGGRLAYWSTAGVPGPTGPTGPTGATGSTGATGAPGGGSTTTYMHVPFGTTTPFLTTAWVIAGVLCQDTVSRSLSVANPPGITNNHINVSVVEFEASGIPGSVYVSNGAIGVPDTQPVLPILSSRIDAMVADPDYPTDARHLIVAWLGNDQTGCRVTVTQ
jgi:hypothetical protein